MSLVPLLVLLVVVVRLFYSYRVASKARGGSSGANRSRRDMDNVASGESDSQLVRLDLKRLDEVAPGLGDAAVRYVEKGDNDSVLLTLGQHRVTIQNVLGHGFWSSEGSWTTGRSDFLLGAREWRPDAVRRYGEVLEFVHGGTAWPAMPGSDKSPMWFRALLHEYGQARRILSKDRVQWKTAPGARARRPWSIDQLKQLLRDDLAPILDIAFTEETQFARDDSALASPEAMDGFLEHLRNDPARRVTELQSLPAKTRAQAMRSLARLKLTEGPYFAFAFSQAFDTAKSAREAAQLLLRVAPADRLIDHTRSTWKTLKASARVELAGVIVTAGGSEGLALLRDLAESETNESVKADLLRRLGEDVLVPAGEPGRADGPDGYLSLDGAWIASPAPAPLPEDRPVSASLAALIKTEFNTIRIDAETHNRENAGQKNFYRRHPPTSAAADNLIAVFEGRKARIEPHGPDALLNAWGGKAQTTARDRVLAHPDLTFWHLVRANPIDAKTYYGRYATPPIFFNTPVGRALRAHLTAGRDLRTYMDMAAAGGADRALTARYLLTADYVRPTTEDWDLDKLWPYLTGHFALLDEALGLVAPSGKDQLSESYALDVLALFGKTPARYMKALLDRAVGDRKLLRRPARRLLEETPKLADILVPLLKHPKSEMRGGAAEWLGDRNEVATLGVLFEAARKEQIPAAKASMLSAISTLGGDIGEFVSPGALLGEAEAGLKKASAKGLDWFPFDGLPRVRQKGGEALDPKVLRWWIVLAAKLKQPGGNPWFDLLLEGLEPADAAKLGLAILQALVAYDTVVASDAEANAYAAAHVDAQLAQYQSWGLTGTREQIFAQLRAAKLSAYLNSANDQKGVLALCVRAPGAAAVNIVKGYFRDHYTRTAQCKALIECLAGNASPLAIQYVLTIAKRWRTKGVQELAAQLVQAIAERRGWTSEELADRTIPTGGFDETGLLELPVGERTYAARLGDEGKIALYNPDGKAVQGLPASAAGEAESSLKASKALLSNARKEVKQVYEFQSRRLYEALCVERNWVAEEWAEHILGHPIVGRLAQRLIWLGLDDTGAMAAAFRPMEDLTLTDASDNPVEISAFAQTRLAHSTALSPGQVEAWKAHLQDYEIAPLFDQLTRPVLSAGDGRLTEITDRRGWMIDTFKLRGAATKLGYNRGAAEDGGMFMTYEKPFDALKMTAVVEFTGNALPEENRPGSLIALRFVSQKKSGGWLNWSHGLPLKDVPKVLLSEAWNDLHAIAAAGTGFDAEWEKKAGW